jgi:hypothetical protein
MTLYSSVNQAIYEHVAGCGGGGLGRASPLYLPQLCVTEEYNPIYSLVICNERISFYIPRYQGI